MLLVRPAHAPSPAVGPPWYGRPKLRGMPRLLLVALYRANSARNEALLRWGEHGSQGSNGAMCIWHNGRSGYAGRRSRAMPLRCCQPSSVPPWRAEAKVQQRRRE